MIWCFVDISFINISLMVQGGGAEEDLAQAHRAYLAPPMPPRWVIGSHPPWPMVNDQSSWYHPQWLIPIITPSMATWSHPSVWRRPSWEESTRRRCPWTGFLVDLFVVWLVVVSLFNSSLMFFLLFKLFFLYFVLLTHWRSPSTGFSVVLASFPLSSLF